MRVLREHHVERESGYAGNRVCVLDEPGAGGAYHLYTIEIADEDDSKRLTSLGLIHFQKGPIQERGVNGAQNEDMLMILIDRLRGFQAGPFPSEYNAKALAHCEGALAALQQRTRDRIARGVEGHNKP